MPTIGYILQTDPTLVDSAISPTLVNDPYLINPYIYCLYGTTSNLEGFTSMIESISNYYAVTDPSLPTLGSILGKISGIQILNHSIESITLPTWPVLKHSTSIDSKPKTVSDKAFATTINFMIGPDSYKGVLPFPDDKTIILYFTRSKRRNSAQIHEL